VAFSVTIRRSPVRWSCTACTSPAFQYC